MRLIKCYIEAFGILTEWSTEFSRGLNCRLADNGTGKSTLVAFIKAMLYGFSEYSGGDLNKNERKKYLPWGGGRFGGSLTLEADGKRYAIERYFGKRAADDSFCLRNADTGRVSTDFGENIGAELFGIDREGFERTVFLSERSLAEGSGITSIKTKLTDLSGVDGDVSDSDRALKLLAEREKLYRLKRGRGGLVCRLEDELADAERELDGIEEVGRSCEARERELIAMEVRRRELSEARRRLNERLAVLGRAESIARDREAYARLTGELRSERERLSELEEFFSSGVPTQREINEARDARTEGESILSTATVGSESSDLSDLEVFFSTPTSREEIADVERRVHELNALDREAAALSQNEDAAYREMNGLFPYGVPRTEDIRAALDASGASGRGRGIAITLLSVAAAVAGALLAVLLHPALLALSVLGAVGTVVGAVQIRKGGRSPARELARTYLGTEEVRLPDALYELLSRRGRYDSLAREREERIRQVDGERGALRADVNEFIARYPIEAVTDPTEAIGEIRVRFERYTAIKESQRLGAEGRMQRLLRAEQQLALAREFLARFRTESLDPFQEIRERVVALDTVKRSIARLEGEISTVAARLPEGEVDALPRSESSEELRGRLAECDDGLSRLDGEIEVKRREVQSLRESYDTRDERLARRDEVRERLNEARARHLTVQRTEDFIKRARDNMTERYLGRTRERFRHYQSMISGEECGEFAIDTSFNLTRSDRGEWRDEECYSRGTRDLYALCLRLALIDSLYERSTPFVILDDPFTALDDGKICRAKELLRALGEEKQIIYLTCSESRAAR